MIEIMLSIMKMFLSFLKVPFYIICVLFAVFFVLIVFNVIVYYFKGYRFKKGSRRILKKRGVFKRLFIDFPKRFVLDLYNKDPDFFKYQGIHLFCGEQGSGKTVAMVEYMRRMQREFPLSKCITNIKYEHQDDKLNHWRQLISYKNGFKGVIVGMDELQNWFSTNASKDFPPEMLEVITQNRKNRRCVLGTSQVFSRLAKPIRQMCTLVYEPVTFFGCITFVRVRKPVLTSDGELKEYKNRGFYFFVHDEELRNAYDTYEVVESLSKSGFKESSDIHVSTYNQVLVGKK